jgi:hypothetical protein
MKNAVWDTKIQFVLHRRHNTSPLQSSASSCYVRFEVFMAVPIKNAAFWDVTPCGSCESRCFRGTSAHITRVKRIGELGTTLIVTANVILVHRFFLHR